MIKFLFLLVLGYFFVKFVSQVIASIAGPDESKTKYQGPYSGGREKDISDKVKIIKD